MVGGIDQESSAKRSQKDVECRNEGALNSLSLNHTPSTRGDTHTPYFRNMAGHYTLQKFSLPPSAFRNPYFINYCGGAAWAHPRQKRQVTGRICCSVPKYGI